MQKLIVSGCSWTAKVCLPNERTWPHLLADKLEMQCINLGAIAAGNEYIFSSILDELVREKRHSKIGLVMAMWSEWTRWDFEQFKKNRTEPKRWNHLNSHSNRQGKSVKPELAKSKFTPWGRSLRYIYMFQKLLEQTDIPYMHVQGIRTNWVMPSERMLYSEIGKDFTKNIYSDKINENKFIGWPPFPELGGMYMDLHLHQLDPTEKNLYLPRELLDPGAHPNEEGHKVIADYLYKKIEEEYGNL